ncbi:MAG: tRNA pseudouridine(55) synthase TruB [Bacteroidetes bacterium]|nr:tRNA pseudouridine(55) synthase TruB [Bacteroidota bacterium]
MITKTTNDFSDLDFLAGEVILIDKTKGLTSFSVVHKIRKAVNVKKVGHAGTLDPEATGLLIICTGKKTKEIYKYQESEKTYTGIISLGKSSASMDAETEFSEEKSLIGIGSDDIENVRKSFLGNIQQMPPMYSAIKHKGKSLYEYARKGVEIKRELRDVTVSKFEILKTDLPDIYFEIVCSKGTYIRVIADDFGKKLGCGAYLKSLRRTAIGSYKVDDALEINDFRTIAEKTTAA